MESNPGPFDDDEECKHVEIYSADGARHLASYKAPVKSGAAVFAELERARKLKDDPPPAGQQWTTLRDRAEVDTTWEQQVDAGRYKIVATMPIVSPPAANAGQ